MRNLIGKKVKVTSNNENYDSFRNKILTIVQSANNGVAYDSGMFPERLCSFVDQEGNKINCSLYEYEFEIIKK